jgi:thymidine kinase
MFLEPNFRIEKRGWIEVICVSMYSGKTEELIRRGYSKAAIKKILGGNVLRVMKANFN